MAYAHAWLVAFVFTQLVEVPIYSVGLRVRLWPAFGASAITHPILWFIIFPLLPLSFTGRAVLGETFVLFAETAYFYFGFRRPRTFFWVALANASSMGLGLVSRHFFGVP